MMQCYVYVMYISCTYKSDWVIGYILLFISLLNTCKRSNFFFTKDIVTSHDSEKVESFLCIPCFVFWGQTL